MASQTRIARSMANDASYGVIAWGIQAGPAAYADYGGGGGTTQYLACTNYGFQLPTSNINGIVVTLLHKGLAATLEQGASDNRLRLTYGGSPGTYDLANTGVAWDSDYELVTYGTATDTWDGLLTFTDINQSTFGCVLSAIIMKTGELGTVAWVTNVRITVYYTEIGPPAATGQPMIKRATGVPGMRQWHPRIR